MDGTAAVSDGNSATASSAASSGPSSFAEAFASDASSASGPAQTSTTPPAAVQPGVSATDSPQQEADDPRSPFIPRSRFDEVNTKLSELKAWREQHGWAEKVDPQQFEQAVRLAQRLHADPVAGLQDLIAEIRQNPQHDAAIKSLAARALAQGRSPQAAPDLNPIQVQLENGQTVGLYSAEQIAALKTQWQSEIDRKLEPLVGTHQQLQAERQAAQRQASIEHYVTTTHQDVTTWPGMESKDAQAAVAKELAAARIDPNDPREVSLALNAAWRKVIAPTLRHKAEATLLDTLKTKAAASSSVNPGSAASSTPKAYASFYDLPKSAWK